MRSPFLHCVFLQLANGEYSQAYHFLQLFAYGTLANYRGTSFNTQTRCPCISRSSYRVCDLISLCLCAVSPGVYSALNEQQLLKLRLLTMISTAETEKVRMACLSGVSDPI